MKRGDIYFASLDPTIGTESKKTRPVLIISNNINNLHSESITIIPLTSNIAKLYPFEVLIEKTTSKLDKDSKAQCHQIRTISKKRIKGDVAGSINEAILNKIEYALKIHLSLT